MYSLKLFLSMLIPCCLNVCAPSHAMLHLANPGGSASEAQEVYGSSAISSQLRAMAAKGQLGNNLGSAGFREQIKSLYESANFVPLWIKGDLPTSQATHLIETLRASRLKGLNPSDYDAESLAMKSRSLKEASAAAEASFDATLTQSTMQYISDLRIGRVNPKHLKFDIDVQSKKYDLPEFIARQVVSAGNVQSALDQIEPPYAGYHRIENTLKQYWTWLPKAMAPKCRGEPGPSLRAISMQELSNWLSDCD